MSIGQMNVVIIGGSLGGLMHGVMFKRNSHNVRILEQYPTSVREGQAAGMSTGLHGQKLLEKYDKIQGRNHFVTASTLEVLDENLEITASRPVPFKLTSWKTFYYRLRANFDGFTSDYVPMPPADLPSDGSAVYEIGKRVVGVCENDGGGLTVTHEDVETGALQTVQADLVIAADGANSTIRKFLFPGLKAPYAGVLTWRGVVPEANVTQNTLAYIRDKCIRYYAHRYYVVMYLIPGDNGSIIPGERDVNLVWYDSCPENSTEYQSIMADVDGIQHQRTVPFGKVRHGVWAEKQAFGMANFPPPIKEIISKIDVPFVTAIHDCVSPRSSHFHGKLFLVGDAFALFRPHAAQSTNQCALHCLLIEKHISGEISLQEYETQVGLFANTTLHWSREIGSEYLDSFAGHLYHKIRHRLAREGRKRGFRL